MTTRTRVIILRKNTISRILKNPNRLRVEGYPLRCSRFSCRKILKPGEKVVRKAARGFIKYYHYECWEAMYGE